jgi:hypothetical protein
MSGFLSGSILNSDFNESDINNNLNNLNENPNIENNNNNNNNSFQLNIDSEGNFYDNEIDHLYNEDTTFKNEIKYNSTYKES